MRSRRSDDDYLRAVHALQTRGCKVSTSGLATWIGVSAPAASMMLKRLQDDGSVRQVGARSFILTEEGERRALRLVRHHRLIETFLQRALGVPWDEVHDEAEALGTAVSERLVERMAAALGHPTSDPHGDPIPPAHGTHDEGWGIPLDAAPAGLQVRVLRVVDRNAEALRMLEQVGIVPGAHIAVARIDPVGGPVWVNVGNQRHALGRELAGLVAVVDA